MLCMMVMMMTTLVLQASHCILQYLVGLQAYNRLQEQSRVKTIVNNTSAAAVTSAYTVPSLYIMLK